MCRHFVIITPRQHADRVIWYPFSFHYKILISRAGFMPPVRGRPFVHKDPYLATHLRICFNWLRGTDHSKSKVTWRHTTVELFKMRKGGEDSRYNRIMSIELNLTVIYIEIIPSIILCFSSRMSKFPIYFSSSI